MANVVPAGRLYKFLSHKRKVLSLYKKSMRHLEAHCSKSDRGVFVYERALLRARFDRYKDEEDLTRSTQLLRLGEEEFWENQHPHPYVFPTEEEGVAFQRYENHALPDDVLDTWEPEERAMFPDFFAKRKKWYELRKKTWSNEMQCLQDWDKENEENDVPLTDNLPAAKEKNGYPPFWWRRVTRPLFQPELMDWFPGNRDAL